MTSVEMDLGNTGLDYFRMGVFVCLFNDSFLTVCCIASNVRRAAKNELEGKVTYFEVLPKYLLGETDKKP